MIKYFTVKVRRIFASPQGAVNKLCGTKAHQKFVRTYRGFVGIWSATPPVLAVALATSSACPSQPSLAIKEAAMSEGNTLGEEGSD